MTDIHTYTHTTHIHTYTHTRLGQINSLKGSYLKGPCKPLGNSNKLFKAIIALKIKIILNKYNWIIHSCIYVLCMYVHMTYMYVCMYVCTVECNRMSSYLPDRLLLISAIFQLGLVGLPVWGSSTIQCRTRSEKVINHRDCLRHTYIHTCTVSKLLYTSKTLMRTTTHHWNNLIIWRDELHDRIKLTTAEPPPLVGWGDCVLHKHIHNGVNTTPAYE